MEIKVIHKIELGEDTKQFIKDVLSGWHKLSDTEKVESIDKDSSVENMAEATDIIRQEAKDKELTTPPQDDVEMVAVSKDEVRSLAIEVGSKKDMDLVKAILDEEKVESITSASPEQLPVIYKKLKEELNES